MHPPADLVSRLTRAGQGHLLHFYPELSPPQRDSLLRQLTAIDWDSIPALVNTYVRSKPLIELPLDLAPAPYYPAAPRGGWDRAACRSAGEALLRAGKVAAFTVAGGQGTRLGFDGPKGCYKAGPITGKTLFQFFAEGLRAAGERFGRPVPWYIMTSPLNHEATIAYFDHNHWLGLNRDDILFFPQGVMPSFDLATGRVLLASKGEVATNPDGHGGSIKALHDSGALEDMRRRRIEHVSYFQVDNPIVRVIDPVFLGLHAAAPDSSAQMSSKMVPKAYPDEKLGLFCTSGGRVRIIEYSDLPTKLQHERTPDGSLRFLAGSIAVHAISVDFLFRLATDPAFSLPYHRADKKVPCIDPDTGRPLDPQHPNAVKLERFVFDALPLCRASVVYETDRVEEFAPIKNAAGTDSPESSARIQTERAARWLERAGITIPRLPDGRPDCTIEVSPLTAVEADDLKTRSVPRTIEPGAQLAL
jgi:UDP-N-acetylglucosamine/UDP-N-acetylgalactosamine diphosphorylase